MRLKKEYILLLLIIMALGVYLWYNKTNRINYQLPQVKELQEKAICKLNLVKGNSSITLRQRDSTWYIAETGFQAKQSKVNKILDSVKSLEITTLISKKENYQSYKLDKARSLTVMAFDNSGKLLRKLKVGKSTVSYNTHYLLLDGDPNVYLAQNTLSRDFEISPGKMRDKTVLAFEQSAIRSFKISNSGTIRLSRKQAQDTQGKKIYWENTQGEKLDRKKVEDFLRDLSGLECSSFYKKGFEKQLNSPEYQISLKGNKKHTLELFINKKDNIFKGISSYSDYAFKLSEYQGKRIRDNARSLLGKQNSTRD